MHLVFWTQSLVFWMVDLEFGMLHWSVWASALLLTIIITTTILLTSLDCLTGKYLQQLILSFKGSTANDMGVYGYGARSLISFKH